MAILSSLHFKSRMCALGCIHNIHITTESHLPHSDSRSTKAKMSLIFTSPAQKAPSVSKRRYSIYLGGKNDAKSKAKLEAWGITHILNMTPEKEAGIKVRTFD